MIIFPSTPKRINALWQQLNIPNNNRSIELLFQIPIPNKLSLSLFSNCCRESATKRFEPIPIMKEFQMTGGTERTENKISSRQRGREECGRIPWQTVCKISLTKKRPFIFPLRRATVSRVLLRDVHVSTTRKGNARKGGWREKDRLSCRRW